VCMNSKKARFKSWFLKQWNDHDLKQGRRTTQQELADYLGVTRASVAQYISGKKIPEGENLARIANRFGHEAYALVGAGLPLNSVPPALATRLQSALSEIANTLAANDIDPDSEEAARVADSIMARFGFVSTDTENP
jgi:transcriptional regulator with XRE-family HTH domain